MWPSKKLRNQTNSSKLHITIQLYLRRVSSKINGSGRLKSHSPYFSRQNKYIIHVYLFIVWKLKINTYIHTYLCLCIKFIPYSKISIQLIKLLKVFFSAEYYNAQTLQVCCKLFGSCTDGISSLGSANILIASLHIHRPDKYSK